MSEWQPIETAPTGRTSFLALNIDGEVHVACIDEYGRIMRRSHQQRRPQRFAVESDGRKVLLDEDFTFDTEWSFWTKGYEFKPTKWAPIPPLPPPPTDD